MFPEILPMRLWTSFSLTSPGPNIQNIGLEAFDYRYDPTGFIVKHYANRDVANKDTPALRKAGIAASIGGPPIPAT
ncbi:hypothetical protein F4774DRAFT_382509 [Daldinia eschscholtzii]|nr:hypothetical protein F4774DRAFT_382509 [Daldinia eschscholtzii]